MKSEPVSGIQPALLRWARQTIGLSVIDVAEKLDRHPGEIAAWESGESAPTYPQLENWRIRSINASCSVFLASTTTRDSSRARVQNFAGF